MGRWTRKNALKGLKYAFLTFAILCTAVVVTHPNTTISGGLNDWYALYVDPTNPALDNLAAQVREDCINYEFRTKSEMDACLSLNLGKRMQTMYQIPDCSPFPHLPQRVEVTMASQQGNCVDKAILAASTLKELNFEDVYLVLEANHECVMVKIGGYNQFLGCNGGDVLGIRKV